MLIQPRRLAIPLALRVYRKADWEIIQAERTPLSRNRKVSMCVSTLTNNLKIGTAHLTPRILVPVLDIIRRDAIRLRY